VEREDRGVAARAGDDAEVREREEQEGEQHRQRRRGRLDDRVDSGTR
jgi:hypothetical protein